jgi:hypothetical protein
MLLPDVFSSNEDLHVRLGREIAYRGWRILDWYIELMCLSGERRYWPRNR